MRRLGITALTLLAGLAQAQVRRISVVVVSPEPELEGAALTAGRVARARLAKDARFELVDVEAGARSAADAEKTDRAKAARDSFARGVDSLDAVEYAKAVDQLGASVNGFLDTDLTATFPELLDAIGMRAVALRLAGNSNPADDELSRLFTLNSGYRFAPGRWPPAIQGWIDRKQAAIRETAPAGLEVASPTAAAEVFVDGTFRGVTPLEVKELTPGRHVLTLRAPGYATKQLEVSAGPGSAVSPVLEVAPGGRELLSRLENLKAGFGRGAPEAAGQGLMAWAGTPELVAVSLEVKDQEVWARATRLTARGVAGERQKSLGSTSAPALEEVAGLVTATVEQADPGPLPRIETSEAGSGRKTWGVVAVGVGVAAGAGAVAAGLTAQAKAKEAKLTPQVDETAYRGAVASARSAALVTDGLCVVAAAGLGAGLYLLLTQGSPAPHGDVAVDVAVTPGGGWVSIGGAF